MGRVVLVLERWSGRPGMKRRGEARLGVALSSKRSDSDVIAAKGGHIGREARRQ